MNNKIKIKIISEEVFQISLSTYLIFLLVESFREGFITSFFEIKILLGIVAISGILVTILSRKSDTHHQGMHHGDKNNHLEKDWFIPSIAAIVTGVLVYFKIEGMGMLSPFIAFVVAAISFYLFFYTKNSE